MTADGDNLAPPGAPSAKRILVVEEGLLFAEVVCDLLLDQGMIPVGPAPRVDSALCLVAATPIDAAILDIQLGHEMSFDVARAPRGRGIPFLFLTGSMHRIVPADFRAVPLLQKPCEAVEIVAALHLLTSCAGETNAAATTT